MKDLLKEFHGWRACLNRKYSMSKDFSSVHFYANDCAQATREEVFISGRHREAKGTSFVWQLFFEINAPVPPLTVRRKIHVILLISKTVIISAG
jgi:hypothetical protein